MARPRLNHFLGLDLGNGNIKIATDDFTSRIPSQQAIQPSTNSQGSVKDGDVCYLVGKGAGNTNFKTRTVDNRNAKIDGIERLYLGAIAHLPKIPKQMHNYIVVSSHAWKTHKDIIKANLEKEKTVTLCGIDTTIKTEVLMVVPEGFGAVYNRKDKVAVLDFGTGTTLLTTYENGKPVNFIPSKEGVQELFRIISKEMIAINGGYPGDEDEIRRSLERGDKSIDGCNISSIYQTCLKSWWEISVKNLSQEASKLSKEGYEIVCVGGGVALPGFSTILSKKGFSPVMESPEMANAIGLYQMALLQGKKKGLVNGDVA
jgi:hypothetical protein